MLIVPGCCCDYCTGDVRCVPSELVVGLVDAARKDRVTIKPGDMTFVINGVRAVGCIRLIRKRLARVCGCWVAPECRGHGIGLKLVVARIAFIENHMSAKAIDTFAFRKRLFLRLGFEERQGYKIGTTALRKSLSR